MENKGYKKILIIVSVALVVALATSIVAVSFAFWSEVSNVSNSKEFGVGEFDASRAGQVFQAIDADGNILAGADAVGFQGFALVGYTGLATRLNILDVVNVKINGDEIEGAVTMVLSPSAGASFYRNGTEFAPGTAFVGFTNSQIVEEIVVPVSIVEISATVFAFMSGLKRVEFLGDSESATLVVGDYAFLGSSQDIFVSDRIIDWGKR